MKTLLISAFLVVLIAVPAFSDSINVLLGYTRPSGNSDVFTQNERETSFRVSDLNGFSGLVGYDHFLGEHFSLGGDVAGYHEDTAVEDSDFEHLDGSPIFRNIHLEVVPIELSLQLLPAGRNAPVIPYVGGGIGVYYWEYEEAGDFVLNRNSLKPSIVTGRAYSDGWDPGWHVEGGIQIPVSGFATIMGEYRYYHAHGNLDTRSFDPSFAPIDLSGSSVSVGASFWF